MKCCIAVVALVGLTAILYDDVEECRFVIIMFVTIAAVLAGTVYIVTVVAAGAT
jgi:hypothetical protein